AGVSGLSAGTSITFGDLSRCGDARHGAGLHSGLVSSQRRSFVSRRACLAVGGDLQRTDFPPARSSDQRTQHRS
ncbi:unnamed protein product, partial [Durusdinium trenchii]